ncbi:hypothetical protein SCLCIDRAFT_1216673 [Scleroderma citrinum Foug A]|uniref:Uncharacterized protein n=1 Tax=Scleroderma citrinum Foug A TaxID=1036808 RepID=A0A0C3DWU2_9AGAM|nr:hypothetical protein SCLCIDRAFT_1216673 [Scleroderma citrinum Foug A]
MPVVDRNAITALDSYVAISWRVMHIWSRGAGTCCLELCRRSPTAKGRALEPWTLVRTCWLFDAVLSI